MFCLRDFIPFWDLNFCSEVDYFEADRHLQASFSLHPFLTVIAFNIWFFVEKGELYLDSLLTTYLVGKLVELEFWGHHHLSFRYNNHSGQFQFATDFNSSAEPRWQSVFAGLFNRQGEKLRPPTGTDKFIYISAENHSSHLKFFFTYYVTVLFNLLNIYTYFVGFIVGFFCVRKAETIT